MKHSELIIYHMEECHFGYRGSTTFSFQNDIRCYPVARGSLCVIALHRQSDRQIFGYEFNRPILIMSMGLG